jgi:hypothetical protein
MKQQVKGATTVIISIFVYGVLAFLISYVYSLTTGDDVWSFIGLFIILASLGLFLVVAAIAYSITKYLKHNDNFYLGVLYGIVGSALFYVILGFVLDILDLW